MSERPEEAEPPVEREGPLDDEHASDPEVIEGDPAANPDDDQLEDIKGG